MVGPRPFLSLRPDGAPVNLATVPDFMSYLEIEVPRAPSQRQLRLESKHMPEESQ